MSDKVLSIHGGRPMPQEPNEAAIAVLERTLEAAKAGEIVGALVVSQYKDCSGGWQIGGFVSSYSMLGAATVAIDDLKAMHREED